MARSESSKDDTPRRWRQELSSPVPAHPADDLLTPERALAFRQVLARRSTRLAVVVEDCYDPHNATAVMRTCDIMGVHRVHVTTGRSRFKINRRISQGAHRYIDLRIHETIDEAYAELRADGYRVFCTDLRADSVIGPQALAAAMNEAPIAVVFGSEGFGVSQAATDGADGHFLIPMAGFSQSLNLSVSVAITLYALRGDALAADTPGDMPADEQIRWYDAWIRRQRGPAVDRLLAESESASPDPRAEIEIDRRGEELETFGPDGPDAH